MIGSIEGAVKKVHAGYALVLAGGIGYKIASTKQTLAGISAGKETFFWTHLAVRENALDLYGFKDEEELRLFELVHTVSGIGPKSALARLDIASVATLRSAIGSAKAEYLTKVSGIGR